MPDPLRILYCEDNLVDAELVGLTLRRARGAFSFEHVDSVAAAKARLEPPRDGDFDVVLTDMNLPDGDGVELIAALRSQGTKSAVVALTGAGDDRMVVAALKAGADDYVFKKGDYLVRLPQLLVRAVERSRSGATERRPVRVLYVENNPVDARLVREYLGRHAPYIQLETAGSGENALQRIARVGTQAPDVVVIDQDLPRMSAFDLVKELRETCGLDLPAVLVTRQGDENIALEAMRLGIGDYLVKSAGFLAQLPAVVEHVHARARLERERRLLAQAQARFYDIVNATGEYVWETDAAMRFTYVSDRVRSVLGYDAEALVGRSLAELMPDGEHARVLEWLQANADAQGSFRELEHRVLGRDGATHWQRLHAAAILDENGRLIGYRGTGMDVTERRRTEEARIARETRLVRQGDALARLSRSQVAVREGLEAALREIVTVSADALQVSRAAVWLLDDTRNVLRCREGYEGRPGRRWIRPPLARKRCPAYFAALEQERTLVDRAAGDADPTQAHPLIAEDVSALLDAPVRLGGTTVGVVCHEHEGGAREWHEDEHRFAASVADLVAVAIESDQTHAARSVRDRLAAILEATSDVVAIADPAGGLRFLNRAGRALLGLGEHADLQAMHIGALHPPASLAQLQRVAIPAAIEQGIWEGETALLSGDGRAIPGSQVVIALRAADGHVEHVAMIVRDLTAVRRAEEALRESEVRLKAFFDHSPALISLCAPDGRFLMLNRRYRETLGIEPQDVVGKTVHDVFPPKYAQVYDDHLRRVVAEGHAISLQDGMLYPDGERSFFTTRFPIFDADGKLVAAGSIATDITALERAQGELAQLNAELEQRVSDRTSELNAALRELEAFSHTVAHDLRAPARAMAGFARVLTTDFGASLAPEAGRMLDRIARNAAHMQQLIDDLLEFSRAARVPVERAPTDLTALAHNCLELLQPDIAGRHVEITISTLGSARADASLFTQVFLNLIANAVKFTRGRAIAHVEVGCRLEGSERVYFVRDDGAGFDMRQADRLFQVFQRLHRSDEFEGTGIGLANVARIVERHGGRVWAEGEVGKGATFYFTIGA